ncbi:MAG: hypothetical protein ACRESR_08605 [Gammaproteobacteria bacterium]
MKRILIAATLLSAALCLAACAPTARTFFGQRLDLARSQRLPLLIYALGVPGEIDVAGNKTAVPVYVQFIVTSQKPLHSVRFTLVGYTKRGIPVRNDDGEIKAVVMTGPGPFKPGGNYEVNSFHAIPAGFPGGDVGCIEPVQIVILYANGEEKTYNGQSLQALLMPPLRRYCEDHGPPVYRVD